jgi:hypothetical protein
MSGECEGCGGQGGDCWCDSFEHQIMGYNEDNMEDPNAFLLKESAPFNDPNCCDVHNDALAAVWSVLTKEENVYTRVDSIVKWIAIYIIIRDEIDRQPGEPSEEQIGYYHVARRRIWEYVRNHCDDKKADAESDRIWKGNLKW